MKGSASTARRLAGIGSLLAAGTLPASAQLRPLDPAPWRVFEGPGVDAEVGFASYDDQRASLAGTAGRLTEIGTLRVSWGLGRVALELGGTAKLRFIERGRFADPLDVDPSVRDVRTGVGDFRLSTQVALSHEGAPTLLGLRFGIRLPTTDDNRGLERDQTDFFALGLAGMRGEGWRAAGEIGLGVHGTRDPANEQVDVLLFGARAEVDLGLVSGVLALAGQHDPRAGEEFRGNEDLGEARAGVRVGERHHLTVLLVRGWTPTSPDFGVQVTVGMRF